MIGEAAPQTETWLSTSTRKISAGPSRHAPHQSNVLSCWTSSVRGSTSHPITAATSPKGTETQNTHCHPNVPSSTPPTAGPALIPIACAAAKKPSALPRRS